jgi:hypothetical protein
VRRKSRRPKRYPIGESLAIHGNLFCYALLNERGGVSPFARVIKTTFDAANPFIDPITVRRDNEWIAGIAVDIR